jgi:hypothetical protein
MEQRGLGYPYAKSAAALSVRRGRWRMPAEWPFFAGLQRGYLPLPLVGAAGATGVAGLADAGAAAGAVETAGFTGLEVTEVTCPALSIVTVMCIPFLKALIVAALPSTVNFASLANVWECSLPLAPVITILPAAAETNVPSWFAGAAPPDCLSLAWTGDIMAHTKAATPSTLNTNLIVLSSKVVRKTAGCMASSARHTWPTNNEVAMAATRTQSSVRRALPRTRYDELDLNKRKCTWRANALTESDIGEIAAVSQP